MARLIASVLTEDEELRRLLTRLLRDGSTPVSVSDGRTGADGADLVIIDGRENVRAAIAAIEQHRSASPSSNIFMLARESSSDFILQSMRAGANEFLTWPIAPEAFDDAVTRTSARRGASGSASLASIVSFIGAKGGVGTTTLAVNTGVELAGQKKSTIMLDLKEGLGDAALFLGVRSRYSIVDALDNSGRVDREFLSGLVAKHVSGLEILPGSDQFARPASNDAEGVENVIRLLSSRYEYGVIDAGSQLNAVALAALYVSEVIGVVINPDVPSIRNGQRLIERINEVGSCGERVRVLLNRAGPPLPIPLAQIENALGQKVHLTFPSDYKTVATALNAGVPLTFSDNSEMAEQFRRWTSGILNQQAPPRKTKERRMGLGFPRFASMW
jgi:pilus assembly protein CpaE